MGGFLLKWGSSGSGNGQFNSPHGVSVDSEGSVYVTDRGNNRVQKFTNTGGFLTKFGSACTTQPCPKDGQFNGPDGIGVGPGSGSSGKVYVTDVGNNRVQVFAIDIRLLWRRFCPPLLIRLKLIITNHLLTGKMLVILAV